MERKPTVTMKKSRITKSGFSRHNFSRPIQLCGGCHARGGSHRLRRPMAMTSESGRSRILQRPLSVRSNFITLGLNVAWRMSRLLVIMAGSCGSLMNGCRAPWARRPGGSPTCDAACARGGGDDADDAPPEEPGTPRWCARTESPADGGGGGFAGAAHDDDDDDEAPATWWWLPRASLNAARSFWRRPRRLDRARPWSMPCAGSDDAPAERGGGCVEATDDEMRCTPLWSASAGSPPVGDASSSISRIVDRTDRDDARATEAVDARALSAESSSSSWPPGWWEDRRLDNAAEAAAEGRGPLEDAVGDEADASPAAAAKDVGPARRRRVSVLWTSLFWKRDHVEPSDASVLIETSECVSSMASKSSS
mmetsp:Transcript_4291/g.17408  ORF Transcript_4291/g.17408 Transcript_4291/m.17408 type:complete len:366 (-) Transcript_4291:1168-2265(-)